MKQQTSIRLLRLPEVQKRMGVCRATIYNMINEGLFPKPVKLGGRTSVFPEHEVDSVLRSVIAESSKEEIRALVSEIEENRRIRCNETLPIKYPTDEDLDQLKPLRAPDTSVERNVGFVYPKEEPLDYSSFEETNQDSYTYRRIARFYSVS